MESSILPFWMNCRVNMECGLRTIVSPPVFVGSVERHCTRDNIIVDTRRHDHATRIGTKDLRMLIRPCCEKRDILCRILASGIPLTLMTSSLIMIKPRFITDDIGFLVCNTTFDRVFLGCFLIEGILFSFVEALTNLNIDFGSSGNNELGHRKSKSHSCHDTK